METASVREASTGVIAALRAAGRPPTTIKRHEAELNAFARFLQARGQDLPTEADCLDFVAERSGCRLAGPRGPARAPAPGVADGMPGHRHASGGPGHRAAGGPVPGAFPSGEGRVPGGVPAAAQRRRFLAPLFAADDPATGAILAEAYRNLPTSPSPAEALRAAELAYLAAHQDAPPTTWAALVAMGA